MPMTPHDDVSVTMMRVALQMRALGEWIFVNHEKISHDTALFLGVFMLTISKHAATTMAIRDDPQRPPRRCIFFY